MVIQKYPQHELYWQSWCWRLLCGPAALIDGLVETFTLGRYGTRLKLLVAKKLAQSRIGGLFAKT